MRFLKAVEKGPTHKTLEVCSRKWGAVRRASLRRRAFDSHLVRCFAGSRCAEMVSGRAALWFCLAWTA